MATPTPPLVSNEEENKVQHGSTDHKKYNNLIGSLPVDSRWGWPLRKHRGFWLHEPHLLNVMVMEEEFAARPTDIILASYPKSGTTWLKALAFATLSRHKYPDLDHHPLLHGSPHDYVPFLDLSPKIEALPSPRLLATHEPYSLLPASVEGSKANIVYICRDPKDALVSAWHFIQSHFTEPPVSLSQAVELFCEGVSMDGPVWDHVLEYWRESLKRPERVLFLRYEEMMEAPGKWVRRLSEFMGCPFTKEEEEGGVVEGIVGLCSFEKLRELEVNRRGVFGQFGIRKEKYFRKGKVGDWVNYLSEEMGGKIDKVTVEKLDGSSCLTVGGVGISAITKRFGESASASSPPSAT